MSTINGKLVDTEQKTSKKGRAYWRFNIEADGKRQWWTYFGDFIDGSIGAECIFATKPMGDGEIIDEYQVTGATSAPAPVAGAPAAAPARVGGHRDMWIMDECIFQHWIACCSDVTPEEVTAMVQHSTNLAMWVDTQFKAYDAGKPLSMAADAQAPNGPLVEKAGDIAARAISGGSKELDDDIPF